MKVFSAVLLVYLVAQGAWARGAGRAFPLASENLAISLFQSVNPYLEWDYTNFLIDLAGHYANCDHVNVRGVMDVDRESPAGDSITAVVDSTYGDGLDADSVNSYIAQVLNSWVRNGDYTFVMRGAREFGCSVRPGCSNQVVVACVFTPGSGGPEPSPQNPTGNIKALAFTDEQYSMAERITGNRWDRSHFLENLSGHETDCAMIGKSDWPFPDSVHGMRVSGLFGYSENRGETQPAMEAILKSFKQLYANKVGCSVIPDCVSRGDDRRMYVVVSCLYEE